MGNFANLRKRARISIHLMERNKIRLTKDYYPVVLPFVIVFSLLLLIYRNGRRAAWRQCLYGIGGWWAGIAGERGAPPWAAV